MKTYKIIIHPLGPFCTPLHADTLFGHMCWAVKHHGWEGESGDEGVGKFLGMFADGPPFLLSDGFIDGFLPFPKVPPESLSFLKRSSAEGKKWESALENAQNGNGHVTLDWRDFAKSFKKFSIIPERQWHEIISRQPGDSLPGVFKTELIKWASAPKGEEPMVKEVNTLKNSISRFTFTTFGEAEGGGGLYALKETFYRETPEVNISIFLRCDESISENIKELIGAVGRSGYGKKKTVGRGAFEVMDMSEQENLEYGGGKFVTLSPFVDLNSSLRISRSRYSLRIKIGKVGENLSVPGMPFAKKPIAFFEPGSVFEPKGDATTFGGLIKGVVPNGEGVLRDVVQYAYAFPVGVNW